MSLRVGVGEMAARPVARHGGNEQSGASLGFTAKEI